MKKIACYFIIFSSLFCYSQKISGFGGVGIYLNRSLDKSFFASINGGLEIKINDNIKPEVEINYFIGAIPDKTKEDSNGIETERLERVISASNLSFSPKIIFGNSEDKIRFQILPKYSFTKVFAKGTLFSYDKTKAEYINTDSDNASETRQSLGIGMGVIMNLSDKTTQSIALNLYYNNIDIANALNNLKFGNANYHTQQSLGLGIIYYFGLTKLTKNNQ